MTLIVLVGLPGSGKTTAGRQLARRLGLPFIDADHVIEQRIGGSIRSFFERAGEAAFRDIEAEVIAELARGSGVLATGGGAVLRETNRAALRQGGHVVYLCSSPDALYARLQHDTKRPLLQVADPLARLRTLYEERDPLYRAAAHSVVDTQRATVASLVRQLEQHLRRAGALPAQP